MSCAACVSAVERAVGALAGIENVSVNLITNSMVVTYDDSLLAPAAIASAVKRAGYSAKKEDEENQSKNARSSEAKAIARRFFISLAILLPLWYIAMGAMLGLPEIPLLQRYPLASALLQFALCAAVVIINRKYFSSGIPKLVRGEPNMDSLISVGVIASLLFSAYSVIKIGQGEESSLYFDSAAMILTLVTLGKWLEKRSTEKTGKAIRDLISLTPDKATIERGSDTVVIDASEIAVGDVVVVLPGALIPADGVALCAATVDESAMTGESDSAEIEEGMSVRAGTINLLSPLRLRATQVASDTTLAKMIRLIEDSSNEKVPVQRLADKISGYFVPVIMAIAAVVALIWFITTQSIETSLVRAISVLVIACPCSLGLATPVAVMAGTGRAANMGIIFRTASAIETLKSVKTVVFDKTGTLTEGRPEVTDVISDESERALAIASALEGGSSHPIASAIVRYANENGVTPSECTDMTTLPGCGVSGIIDAKQVFAGSRKLAESKCKIDDTLSKAADALASAGKTTVFIGEDDKIVGVIATSDRIRADARDTAASLSSLGISSYILSGDNEAAVARVKESIGAQDYRAAVLPDGKADAIKEIERCKGACAMVGDGINDAAALCASSVGIAMGSGTDIAAESSDIVLMRNDLIAICDAVELSRATFRIIRQNLFWALFYNCIGVAFAAGAFASLGLYATPELAALAMSLSSFFVVSNALRLTRFKPSREKTEKKNKSKGEKTMEKVITIEGMMCMHCAARVQKALEALGDVSANVDLDANTATVTGGQLDDAALKKAVEDAGYTVISIK